VRTSNEMTTKGEDTMNQTTAQLSHSLSCPQCNKEIPTHKGYVTWCECGYQDEGEPEQKEKNRLNRLYERLGQKRGKMVFEKIKENPFEPVPRLTLMLAYLLSTIIHLISLGTLLSGIYCLLRQSPSIFSVALGLFLCGVSWLIRPRWNQLEEGSFRLDRKDFPHLYEAVDRLSDHMKTKRIDGIAVNHEWNASIGYYGWKKECILTIGYPLFSVLANTQKQAIIAHELGHLVNKDLSRTMYIGTAIHTLDKWVELLTPIPLDEREDNLGFFELPAYYFMALISRIPYLYLVLLVHLLFDDSQKGEYLADLKAAETCGKEPLLQTFTHLQYGNLYNLSITQALPRRKTSNVYDLLNENIQSLPPREIERYRWRDQLEHFHLDHTHPPTKYRSLMISHLPQQIERDSSLWEKASFELGTIKEDMHEDLMEEVRYWIS